MIYLKGHLARPLDALLGSASRLASARALFASPEGLSGRQVAQRAGINHQAAALALKALESAGVAFKRENSRSSQWKLDRRRFLVRELLLPLFEGEARCADEIAGAIKSHLDRKSDAVIIFGEAAQGRLAAGAPLELAILCEPGRRRALNEALRILIQELEETFGLALTVIVLTKKEASVRLDIWDGWQLLPTEGRPSAFTAAR
jgi:hypothetical protein